MDDYRDKRLAYNRPSFRKILKDTLPSKCCNCGSDVDIQYHHIVPLRLGGTNKLSNIVPLCRVCHNIAHGSENIREICASDNPGRKRVNPPENYEDILWDYLKGDIGKKECHRLLNITGANKITDKWYFKEFLKKANVKSYRNNVDTFNQTRLKDRREVKTVVAKIIYTDGTEYIKRREV